MLLRLVLNLTLVLQLFSNAIEINVIPNARPITDNIFTSPTNLNAIPIAKTATAINNIVPTPFLISLSLLGSASISLVLADSFC